MKNNKIRLFTIPNIVTLMNLACGTLAVVMVLAKNDLKSAFWLVIAAAVFDFLDGFVARALKMYSDVGKQLDSLCDMVSFGLVPSLVLYAMFPQEQGAAQYWQYAAFLVVLFSALRLAKFNVDESQSDSFVGMPTPACALFVAAAGYMYADGLFTVTSPQLVVAAVVLSFLLVSPIRMIALKFKNFSIKDNWHRFLLVAGALVALVIFKINAIPFIIAGYVLVSIATNLFKPKVG